MGCLLCLLTEALFMLEPKLLGLLKHKIPKTGSKSVSSESLGLTVI